MFPSFVVPRCLSLFHYLIPLSSYALSLGVSDGGRMVAACLIAMLISRKHCDSKAGYTAAPAVAVQSRQTDDRMRHSDMVSRAKVTILMLQLVSLPLFFFRNLAHLMSFASNAAAPAVTSFSRQFAQWDCN